MKKQVSERDEQRAALRRAILRAVWMILGGILLLAHPDFGSKAVAVTAGWGMIAVGGIGIVVCLLSWPVMGLSQLAACMLTVGFGAYILLRPLALASLVGIALGVYLLVQSIGIWAEAVRLHRGGFRAWPGMVLAAGTDVLGIVLIWAPLAASRLVMTLCGVGLLVCGAVNLFLRCAAARKLHTPQKRTVIDADE